MEYIRIKDLSTATEEELFATQECNSRIYRLMSTQVENLRRTTEMAREKGRRVKEQAPVTEEEHQPTIVQSDIDEEFEEEVEFYYSEVKKLTQEELEENLEEALPSRQHYEYERILYRLQAELMRECKEIREYMATEDLSAEDAAELTADLDNYQAKITAISKQLILPSTKSQEIKPVENNLVFVPTSGGNIRVLDEMADIDSSFYKKFNELFSSIKNGTFKGVKKLHGDLAGLAEVKDRPSGARVTFVRLDKNTYALISAFIKKSDNSSGYQKMLYNHYQSYREVEQQLIDNLSNPEFMGLHKEYETELFNKLNPNQNIKTPTYQKRMGAE